MILKSDTNGQHYDIVVERGVLQNIGDLLDLNRNVLLLTDDGVPARYADTVSKACKNCVTVRIKQGEASKNFDSFKHILSVMLQNGFTRKDCVVALGGGVVGDIAGFAASCYMRGVNFYNIPTTLLAQLDSSIGGKTAIDFDGVKNVIGSFYQPSKVVIDLDTLKTLDERQLHAGLAEGIKMALTSNKRLFEIIEESEDLQGDLQLIVQSALIVKRDITEKDPKEQGLRKVLNFGHTIGHAVESAQGGKLLHGECVGIGMLPMCSQKVRQRLEKVLEKYNLPTSANCDKEELLKFMLHDKKSEGDKICAVIVDAPGAWRFEEMTAQEILDRGYNL